METNELPLIQHSLVNNRGFFWTKGPNPKFFREIVEGDADKPTPAAYEVRMDPSLVVAALGDGDDEPGSPPTHLALISTIQPWQVEGLAVSFEASGWGTHYVGINSREELERVVMALLEKGEEVWPSED